MNKRIGSLMFLIILVVLLTACGAATTPAPVSQPAAATTSEAAAPTSEPAAANASSGEQSEAQAIALKAAGGQQLGGTLNILGVWGGSELGSFLAVVKPFEESTGVKVQFEGTRDFNAVLTTRVEGNNPPILPHRRAPDRWPSGPRLVNW